MGAEEVVEEGGGVGGEDAGDHLGAVVEAAVADDVPEAADGAGLVVVGAEDQAVDPGQDGGAGAHRARLEGDHQGAAGEPPLAAGSGGRAEGDDLGVAGGVGVGLADVAAAGDHSAGGVHDDRADRYVARRQGRTRLVEGGEHRLPPGHVGQGQAEVRPTASSNWVPKPSRRATSDSASSG